MLALCALVVALRLRGIDFLLPHFEHLDGQVLVRQVEMHRQSAPVDVNDEFYGYYPHLLSRLTALWPDPRPTLSNGPALAEQLARAKAHWRELRVASCLLSCLTIAGTWLLARRFFERGWAFAAAALGAGSLLQAVFSTDARPHGTASAAMLFAVLASLALLQKRSFARYLLAGLGSGLAVGALHYGVFVLPCLLVAHFAAPRAGEKRSVFGLGAALALVALCVRVFYPFHFSGRGDLFHFGEQQGERVLNLSGQPLLLERFDGTGFRAIAQSLWSYDPLILVLASAGSVWLGLRLLRRRAFGSTERKSELFVLAVFLVPYILVIGLYRETWERFLLPLLPYFALAAIAFVQALARRVAPRLAYGAGGALASACLFAPGLALQWHLGSLRRADDTLEQAAQWVEQHCTPEHERIDMLPYIDLPLFHSAAAIAALEDAPWNSRWLYFERYESPSNRAPRWNVFLPPAATDPTRAEMMRDPLGWWRAHGSQYVVIEADAGGAEMLGRARADLARQCELVARFTPLARDDGSNPGVLYRHPFAWDDPFVSLCARAERAGPTLEIYRVNGAPSKH